MLLSLSRRALALVALPLALLVPLAPAARAQAPQPPELAARAYVLIDVTAGQELASRNPDQAVEPASLTKLMTAYLVFQALREKKLDLQQELAVSERAWRTGMTGASRSFIDLNSKVKVEDLIKGMIVQSGNDATVALAEGVSGTVEQFVERMNRQALAFGLKATSFRNPEGLTAAGHTSTARELAVIARRLMADFPESLPYYSMRDFTYNKIKQENRNLLLRRDPSVDGLKTGYTDAAGYCLIATARREFPNGQRRLLSVVLGTTSAEARAIESQKLLNWGYSAYDAIRLFEANQAVATPRVWKGSANQVKVGLPQALYVAVPRGQGAEVRTEVTHNEPLLAPIAAGQPVGRLKVMVGTQELAAMPITALEAVGVAGLFGRAWDSLRLLIQ
jgi:D-alanyl-D-alanine carboxypeptidase (penicillin-binding protein 5/6)